MAEASPKRSDRSTGGRFVPREPPRMVFEIQILEGPEGVRLRREQAQVIREVVEWVAQRRSEPGSSGAPAPEEEDRQAGRDPR
ncbi:hypothetical protein GCM10010094_77780 [Streptomyces flaveus]|uniref:Uncharacterized protein n=1 Tax=Streptomyces flaveus TaxID=66370 RepID=A0A917RGG7_9ACTN|nr:hypothetical protein GCM10010094_77780 [Streptomyces flaveus]